MDIEDSLMSLKGFKFSLDTPLKVKKIHKVQLETKLADARNKVNTQKQLLDELQNEEFQLYFQLESLVCEGIGATELRDFSLYLNVLTNKIHHHQLELNRLQKVYRDLQNQLIRLLNEIDRLEELRERKLKEYLKDIEMKEEKALEERINYKSSIQGGKVYG